MPLLHTVTPPKGARFSPSRAERPVRFIEKATVHTKDPYSGKPFKLADWQAGSYVKTNGLWRFTGIVRPLFGTMRYSEMHERWVRQFRIAWLEMARKNGKSELMAALGLYLLMGDDEQGGQIYGAASDREQASMVFDVARDMILLSPVLKKELKAGRLDIVDSRKRIVHVPSRSVYQIISADAAGNLGANPSAVLFDEILAQPNRDLFDYLLQGRGTRTQPLLIGVTTAGPNRESFCYLEHEFSLRLMEDPDLSPDRFIFMAYVDEKVQDWENEKYWPEANPGMWLPTARDGFLDIEILRDELRAAQAKGDLSEIANFRIFRLNQWGNRTNAWLDINVWDESEDASEFTEDDYHDISGVGGLDLAETTDLACWVVILRGEDKTMILPHFFITRQAIQRRHKAMAGRFEEWERDGLLTVFETDVHDYDKIRQRILDDIEKYHIQALGFDRFQAPSIVVAVEAQTECVCENIPQTTTRMNPGAKELTRLMGLRQMGTNHNPLMRWNARVATYKMDDSKHIKPDKSTSTDSIDGIVALVNGLSCLVALEEEVEPNVYVSGGEEES